MPKVANLKISDDELRETIEANQLRLMKERGADLTIFSPAPTSWRITSATSRSARPGSRSAMSSATASPKSFPTISSARRCCRKARASIRRVLQAAYRQEARSVGRIGLAHLPDQQPYQARDCDSPPDGFFLIRASDITLHSGEFVLRDRSGGLRQAVPGC